MTHAVISGVLEQLRSILQTDQVNLLAGVRNESEKLADTLSLIQGVIEDAEEKQVNSPAVKVWLEQLTRISYDADDVSDECKTRILSSQIHQLDDDHAPVSEKVWSWLFSLFSCLKSVEVRNDFGSKMIDINERLDRTVKDIALLNLTERQSHEEPRVVTSSFVDDSEIYGRVDDIYSIVSMLLSETSHQDSRVPLISIVGTAGFGKTTLAQLILKDGQVTNNFEKLMWVCVSQPFNLERVAKSIIEEATSNVPSTVAWQALHKSLSESVRGKKFLLVLDDVWTYDLEVWRKLKVSLDGGAQGSRIIITTRDETIAEKMGSTYTHRLGELSDEECWSLFKHIALKEIQDDREKFDEIGKQIVWKCKGVPLAVKIIASLMRRKGSILAWGDVLASDIWEEMSKDEHGFLPSLLLSYYALPSCLKRCFSYCAVFRQDAKIDKDKLVKLWMAQGFLNYDSSKDLEKTGTTYFNDLAMRSLFQDFEKDSEGDIISCKMHDLVHDFAQFLSKRECCILETNDTKFDESKVRHLAAIQGLDNSSLYLAKKLRTFLMTPARRALTAPIPIELYRQLTCLRTLDLGGCEDIVELPNEVRRLLHLRYLNVSGTKLPELPETVCNLYNLQTLLLNWCRNLQKLPDGIGKLSNLRHLESEDTPVLDYLPRGIGRLGFLRTLEKFIVDGRSKGCKIGELKHLNFLQRGLEIKGLGRVGDMNEAAEAELEKKKDLHLLALDFGEDNESDAEKMEGVLKNLQPHENLRLLAIEGYPGLHFPDWIARLSNLVKLRLSYCKNLRVLPDLSKLKSLETLGLDHLDKLGGVQPRLPPLLEELYLIGDLGVFSKSLPLVGECYPNLKSVWIYSSPHSSLPKGFNRLTSIQSLQLWNCETLDFELEELKHLTMLQELKINNCPVLKERFGEGKELKINH